MKQSNGTIWKKAAQVIRDFVNEIKRFLCEGEVKKPDPRDQIWEKSAHALHPAIVQFGQGITVDTDSLTEIVKVGAFLGRKNKRQLNRLTKDMNDLMDLYGEIFKQIQYIKPDYRETLGAICKCYMMLDKGVRR